MQSLEQDIMVVFMVAYASWIYIDRFTKPKTDRGNLSPLLQMVWYLSMFYSITDFVLFKKTISYLGMPMLNYVFCAVFLVGSLIRLILNRTLKNKNEYDELVTSGILGFVRYPIILAYLFQLTGITMIFGSVGGLVIGLAGGIPLAFKYMSKLEKQLLDHYTSEFEEYVINTRKVLPGIY